MHSTVAAHGFDFGLSGAHTLVIALVALPVIVTLLVALAFWIRARIAGAARSLTRPRIVAIVAGAAALTLIVTAGLETWQSVSDLQREQTWAAKTYGVDVSILGAADLRDGRPVSATILGIRQLVHGAFDAHDELYLFDQRGVELPTLSKLG